MKPSQIDSDQKLRQRAKRKIDVDEDKYSYAESKRLLQELQVHKIELEMQNDELRLAQHELEESRKRYFELFDMAPLGYLTLDKQGKILDANLTFVTLMGVVRAALLNTSFAIYIHPDDRDIFFLQRRQPAEPVMPQDREMRMLRADGSSFWVELKATPARNDEYWIVLEDIGKRKQAEMLLQLQSETEISRYAEQYRAMVATHLFGFWLMDSSGKLLDVNETYCRMSGYCREELLQLSVLDIEAAESAEETARHIKHLITFGADQFETRHRAKDGRIFDIEVSTSILSSSLEIIVFIRDISDRKQAERALMDSEARYHAIVEDQTDLICRYQPDGKISFVNEAYLRCFGKKRNQLINRNYIPHIPEPDLSMILEQLKGITPGRSIANVEHRVILSDGTICWLQWVHRGIFSPEGALIEYQAVGRDITERKRAEEELQERGLFLDTLLNAIPLPIFFKDKNGSYIGFNRAYGEFYGQTKEELIGKSVFDIAPRELAELYHVKDMELILNAGSQVYESQLKDARGVLHQVIFHKAAFLEQNGEVNGLIGAIMDITERKRAEEALRSSREKFKAYVDNSLDVIFVLNGKGVFQFVSRAWERHFKTPFREVFGKHFAAFVHPDDVTACAEYLTYILSCKKGMTSPPYRVLHADGSWRWFIANGSRYLNTDNEWQYIGVGHDITERKLAEIERELNEKRLHLLLHLNTLTESTEGEIFDFALEAALATVQSEFGFISFLNDTESVMTKKVWSKEVMGKCSMDNSSCIFPVAGAGLVSDCVRRRGPILVNDYDAPYPGKKGCPAGHIPIKRFLAIPVFDGDRIVAVAAAANKVEEYKQSDINALIILMERMFAILHRRRMEKAERRANEYLDNLLNYASAPIIVWDDNFAITRFNRAFESLTGLTSNQVLGNHLDLLFPEEDIERSLESITNTHAGERWESIEIPIQHADGSVKFILWNSATIFEADGTTPIATIAQGVDVTERRRVEEKLRKSEELYHSLVETSQDLIWRCDEEGRYTYLNLAWEQIFGYELDEMLGKRFTDFQTPEYAGRDLIEFNRLMEGNSITGFETVHIGKSGNEIHLVFNALFMSDEHGNIVGISGTAYDITERKRAEAELHMAKAAAEAANKAKSAFLATMSHEIRTPMNALFGNIELLAESHLAPKQQEYLKDCRTASQMLLQVIDDVLDFSKIEAGKMELIVETFQLSSLARQMVRLFAGAAEQKGLMLNLSLAVGLPAHVSGDKYRLRQIISNLLSNAIKFTDHGTVSLEIGREEPSSNPTPDSVVLSISVRDTGKGIPSDKQALIFDSFTQVEEFSTRRHTGTGLGLAICRRLAEIMGGTISLSSVPGEGSLFTLSLPVGAISDQSQQMRGRNPKSHAAITRNILLADDDDLGRSVTATLLQRRGHNVTAVENGYALLEALERHKYDIILSDISMPDLDGMEVLRIIRSGEYAGIDATTPIIAMTAHAFAQDRVRFQESGFNGYVSKPVIFEALLSQIDEICDNINPLHEGEG
ncbi:MAG: PAS domain S-box protein [Desulfuromonadaceae bacterium]|nr:PAS domain S-box protein [Desulfuromonadaceae bacterium]